MGPAVVVGKERFGRLGRRQLACLLTLGKVRLKYGGQLSCLLTLGKVRLNYGRPFSFLFNAR